MKKILISLMALLLSLLLLAGCGAQAKPMENAAPSAPAGDPPAGHAGEAHGPAPEAGPEPELPEHEESERQDGERFEGTVTFAGMDETVQYEHLRNDTLGFSMDYEVENFVRISTVERELFVSVWDDLEHPENYLEVKYNPVDAQTVAANIAALLSAEYEVRRDDAFVLNGAGTCIRLAADEVKGGGYMAEQLQTVYVIPAADGCRIAWEHMYITDSEGFGKHLSAMLHSLTVRTARGDDLLTDERAASAIRNYCLIQNPDLNGILQQEDAPVYWELLSSDGDEIVVLYRSYTGAQNRYYINAVTGEATVTQLVPGILDEEQSTEEVLNVWEYSF